MSAVQKFMFDRTFDGTPPTVPEPQSNPMDEVDTEIAVEEQLEEEEIQPGYSEEQLEAAKKDAFESGKQEGLKAATKTVEQETLVAIRSIVQHLTDLFGKQEHANNTLMMDTVGVATTIVRKLYPAMEEVHGLGEMERLIEHTLLRLIEEPRVVVKINPELMDSLGKRLDGLKAGAGYEGRIVLKEDASMSVGDCRLVWGDGSAERNVAALWQSIDDIVENNIGKVVPKQDARMDVDVALRDPTEPESHDTTEDNSPDDSSPAPSTDDDDPQKTAVLDEKNPEVVDPPSEPDIVEPTSKDETPAPVEPLSGDAGHDGDETTSEQTDDADNNGDTPEHVAPDGQQHD